MSDDSDIEQFPLRRGKRKKTYFVHDSDSGTDGSSESPVQQTRRRKRVPRVSESDRSSSESDIIVHRTKKVARVNDDDSDASTSGSSYESASESDTKGGENAAAAGTWSDSSDGTSEKCPICLISFKNQEVGSPETCDHSFCAECIEEWSKNVNTCPVDRQEFSLILVRRNLNGRVVRHIPVQPKNPQEVEEDFNLTYCEVCGQSDREERMLLCDGCDLGYHLECLDPPLDTVPVDEWYCPECSVSSGTLADTVDIYEGEIDGLLQEMEEMGARLAPRPRRLLPRTRQSERVRATVQTQRSQRSVNSPGTSRNMDQPSTSSGFESLPDQTNQANLSTNTHRKRKRKNRRRKRKSRRRKARVVVPKTVKKRLANHLGILPIRPSQKVPDIKAKQCNGIQLQRTLAGIPSLNLFGHREELDYFSDQEDEEVSVGFGSSLLARARPAAAISLRTHQRLKSVRVPSPAVATTPCDILGSILDSQSKFLSKDAKLSLGSDGKILVESNNDQTSPNTLPRENILDVQSAGVERVSQAPMYPGYGNGGNRPQYGFNNNRGGAGGSYRGGGTYGGNSSNNGNYYNAGSSNRGRGNGFGANYDSRNNRSGYMDFLHRGRGNAQFQRGRGAPRFPPRRPPLNQNDNMMQSNNFNSNQQYEPQQTHELDLSRSVQENEISRSTEPIPDTSNNFGPSADDEEEDLDIYSDIETNKPDSEPANEVDSSAPSLAPPPLPPSLPGIVYGSDSDEKDSDTELVIDDTEKEPENAPDRYDPAEPSADQEAEPSNPAEIRAENYDPAEPSADTDSEPDTSSAAVASTSTCQSSIIGPQLPEEMKDLLLENPSIPVVQPRIVHLPDRSDSDGDDEPSCPNMSIYSAQSTKHNESDEDCPNFSIYSAESIVIAKVADATVTDAPVESSEKNLEPDSVQNDEVESSTKDFDEAEGTAVQPREEPDSVENATEPDSNNMETGVPDCAADASNDAITPNIASANQSEEVTTTQKEDSNIPKKLPIKIDINMKKDLDRKPSSSNRILQLYDDSDFEEWTEKEKIVDEKSEANNVMAEIEKLTEAVSEEERCYTPCMDEKREESKDEDEDNDGSDFRQAGIGGLDTEMVSEDEKNDFDESQEVKTVSDGEALEINAKDHELDLAARAEDYEEGEIVEGKKKAKAATESTTPTTAAAMPLSQVQDNIEISDDQEDGGKEKRSKATFKKMSKNTKDRNYRDKDRSKSRERKNKDKENKERKTKAKKKEKKKELERYDVRNIIGQRAMKDKFGRDEQRDRSPSRERRNRRSWGGGRSSSRSQSRPIVRRRKSSSRSPSRRRTISRNRRRSRSRRSASRSRRSPSRRTPSRRRSVSRSRSRHRRSISRSRSYSPYRPRSKNRRLRRSKTRSRTPVHKPVNKRKSLSKSKERPKERKDKTKKKKKKKSVTPERTRLSLSASPAPRNPDAVDWERARYRRDWTPSWSRSPSPRIQRTLTNVNNTWTPPIHHYAEQQLASPKLTVYLRNNDAIRKKKDKKKKIEKRKESSSKYSKKRRRVDRTPPPSKEVFASGDNILVSVSFNKPTDENGGGGTPPLREVITTAGKRKRTETEPPAETNKKSKKDKTKKKTEKKKKKKDTTNVKPVAIIDLEKSPFKELTPSPRDVIVLTDSENGEKEAELMERQEMLEQELLEMNSQEEPDSAPQSPPENYVNTGPKTPPEPAIKFHIAKPAQLIRNVQNPLHDDQEDAVEEDMDPQEELELRLNEAQLHKGPNTPPEPPSSPPSSPDVYDPFEPTKSRSPSPEPASAVSNQSGPAVGAPDVVESGESSLADLAVGPLESSQKNSTGSNNTTDVRSSPMQRVMSILNSSCTEHSPTGEQSSNTVEQDSQVHSTPEKTIEGNPIAVVINRQVQQPPPAIVKPMVSTQAYSSSNSTMITSTPIVQSVAASRQSIFNTTTSSGLRSTPTSIPQRIVLPTSAKTTNNKLSPLKTSSKGPIKSTPIKPMQSKTIISKLPMPTAKPYTPRKKNAAGGSKPNRNTTTENGVEVIEVDLDFDSPYSPGSSDFDDLFEPPAPLQQESGTKSSRNTQPAKNSKSPAKQSNASGGGGGGNASGGGGGGNAFDSLFGSSPVYKPTPGNKKTKGGTATKVPVKYDKKKAGKQVGVKLDEDSLKILDDLPSSAVELQVKDKFLKKLNRQERVVEEVKLVLKPHYNKKHVTKEQYKDILRRSVPKICHNKSGEINPKKIQCLIDAYVKKARAANRKTGTIGGPPQNQTTNQVQPKP